MIYVAAYLLTGAIVVLFFTTQMKFIWDTMIHQAHDQIVAKYGFSTRTPEQVSKLAKIFCVFIWPFVLLKISRINNSGR